MTAPRILMCPPDFYGIHYEINPWMDMSRQVDHAVAVSQWHSLYAHIQAAGAKVSLLKPVEGLPDLMFTANAAMIYRRQALVSRFRHRQRQGEEPHNRHWFFEHGLEIAQRRGERRGTERAGAQIRRVVEAQEQKLHEGCIQSSRVTSVDPSNRATMHVFGSDAPNSGCQDVGSRSMLAACWKLIVARPLGQSSTMRPAGSTAAATPGCR